MLYFYMSVWWALVFVSYCYFTATPYEPLFDNPMMSASPKELWSNWNSAFRNNLRDLIFTPTLHWLHSNRTMRKLTGKKQSPPTTSNGLATSGSAPPRRQYSRLQFSIAAFATFLFSGLLHEYMCWSVFEMVLPSFLTPGGYC
jgi:hypothetical protein